MNTDQKTRMLIIIPTSLKTKIKRKAKKWDRSMNKTIELILADKLK